jgi:hypothetical protein
MLNTKNWEQKHRVYWLVDKKSRTPFYVGLTYRPLERRLISHISDATNPIKKSNAAKHQKIRSLECEIDIELVSEHDHMEDGKREERYWVQQLNAWGFDVVNKRLTESPRLLWSEDGRYTKARWITNGHRQLKNAL